VKFRDLFFVVALKQHRLVDFTLGVDRSNQGA
jgi:hypothetical protein